MTVEYQRRLEKHYDELKWLYCELYPNGQGRFEELCASMEQWYNCLLYTSDAADE